MVWPTQLPYRTYTLEVPLNISNFYSSSTRDLMQLARRYWCIFKVTSLTRKKSLGFYLAPFVDYRAVPKILKFSYKFMRAICLQPVVVSSGAQVGSGIIQLVGGQYQHWGGARKVVVIHLAGRRLAVLVRVAGSRIRQLGLAQCLNQIIKSGRQASDCYLSK